MSGAAHSKSDRSAHLRPHPHPLPLPSGTIPRLCSRDAVAYRPCSVARACAVSLRSRCATAPSSTSGPGIERRRALGGPSGPPCAGRRYTRLHHPPGSGRRGIQPAPHGRGPQQRRLGGVAGRLDAPAARCALRASINHVHISSAPCKLTHGEPSPDARWLRRRRRLGKTSSLASQILDRSHCAVLVRLERLSMDRALQEPSRPSAMGTRSSTQ